MVSKSVASSMLLLRILALAASAATVALLVTNNVSSENGELLKSKFKDFTSNSYVVAVAAVAAAYCIVQLPFGIYYVVKQKRLIKNGFLPEFDFYGDKVISLLLATAIGVGFGVSIEFKNFFDSLFDVALFPKDDPIRRTSDKFYIRGIVASAVLAVACLAMAVVSVISSINRSKSKGFFG